jgi:alanine racemase
MDMCFADVTDIDCREGDDVVIYGDAQTIHHLSAVGDTIPYEIFTSVSQRVKRVYYHE